MLICARGDVDACRESAGDTKSPGDALRALCGSGDDDWAEGGVETRLGRRMAFFTGISSSLLSPLTKLLFGLAISL
jgi:hypothetical protein